MSKLKHFALLALLIGSSGVLLAQAPQSALKLKEEFRKPWTRSDETYFRGWIIAGAFRGSLQTDCFADSGGEASLFPTDGRQVKLRDGSVIRWHFTKAWGDVAGFSDLTGTTDSAVAYAFTTFQRTTAGKVMLSVGSLNGVRAWVNGTLVLSRDSLRSCTLDEDLVEVAVKAGENHLLLKLSADGSFSARILETGSVFPRVQEIGPSLIPSTPDKFFVKTDIGSPRVDAEAVKVEVIRPGGETVYSTSSPRGATVEINAQGWAQGPYDVRFTTTTLQGLLSATHLPWYKGDFLPLAKELSATATAADALSPEGSTLKMLSEMVEDRLGCKLSEVKGNPWPKVHSPLMEYQELMLERQGKTGRIRPYGFVRFAYRDEVDGTPQFCRAYLPGGYDPAKKWPVVIQLHGYNPANPIYVRWWGADVRHAGMDGEYTGHQGVIYIEAHGRGNTQYLGMGDNDILRVIAEAKRLFNVDEDKIFLTGDSMGGWGTWNVATRHPDLFGAIAPVFGGLDYHSVLSEEELSRLTPLDRFFREKSSSWGMADVLLNVPILVRHGDADQSVNVDYSRYGVRLLQRWGYDVTYREYPGRGHEVLENGFGNGGLSIDWFLQHRRNPDPRHVRIRSAELRNASAYWVHVRQAASPLAFMCVDAEVIDRNVIRLDSDNILEIDLSPSPVLIDAEKPIKVVWNGVARKMKLNNGTLKLTAQDYHPADLHKVEQLPGTMTDFTVTPFAVVIGTISKDTAMVSLCRQKGMAFVGQWMEWQKQPPRVFDDTKISDEDMAKYSLLLIGGADANKVAKKLLPQLPLKIASGKITIDGTTFQAKDAALQMIYPNPLNHDRYVLIAAGTSPEGMYFNEVNPQQLSGWDFVISDGRIPAFPQKGSPQQMAVASGMFDYNWRYSSSVTQTGDSVIRANAHLRHRPNAKLAIAPSLLDSFTGRYQITQGPLIEVLRDGNQLKARAQGDPGDGDPLVPEDQTSFCLARYNVWISFIQDTTGTVTGLIGYQGGPFEGEKVK